MLGLKRDKVILLPHQTEWAKLFEQERALIETALAANVLEVQHIGSTAIPDLKAKPILDIAVAVRNFEDAFVCVAPLEHLGYLYRGEYGIARRHYFVKGPEDVRSHHLHMLEIHSENWQNHLLFRNHLKAHSEVAAAYGELKMALARRYPNDREGYTEGKHDFVQSVLAKARAAPHVL